MRYGAFLAAYYVAAMLTFGDQYNHFECAWKDDERLAGLCRSDRALSAVAVGLFWPIYWSGTLALQVTE